MSLPKILVSGATGRTGSVVAAELLKAGYPVRAMAHREDGRSEQLKARGAEIAVADMSDVERVADALTGVQRAYFCPPYDPYMVQGAVAFAVAAKEARLEHIVGLTDRIRSALATISPDDQSLTVAQLAPLDQFHTRGMLATTELADAVGLEPASRVLDLGCGIGGPARYLAATFGCSVTGVDLSPGFIDAANYLTARCGLSDRVRFEVGDALQLPFETGAFDSAFLQHVAMNIEDRAALYAGVRRILVRGGRFAIYDLVSRDGDVVYPVPWARDASASFLRSEADTRAALEHAGFKVVLWRDDTQTALDWFKGALVGPPLGGPNLGVVMGPDFPAMAGNLARNIRENRLGVLSAVLTRD